MRQQRIRYVGLLFFATVSASLLTTSSGLTAILDFWRNPSASQSSILAVAITGGIAFFSAEEIGFIFNGVFAAFWRLRGGYSGEWKRLDHNFKKIVLEKSPLDAGLGEYREDVFLSYFWQQGPKPVVEWVSRRYDVFFSGMTAITGLTVASIISCLSIWWFTMGFTYWHVLILGVALALIGTIRYNSVAAKTEGWQMVDLWARGKGDPVMSRALRDVSTQAVSPQNSEPERNPFNPLFAVLRANDVALETDREHQKLFYLNRDLDIVFLKTPGTYLEPKHVHTANLETYYVISGHLSMKVNEQEIPMNAGDVMIVYPGTCHSFSTQEGVTLLATKKEAGISDKQTC